MSFSKNDLESFFHKIKHGNKSHIKWLADEFNDYFGLNIETEGNMKLRVKRLHEDSIIPAYQTSGSAGFDLHAVDNYVLMPGETSRRVP